MSWSSQFSWIWFSVVVFKQVRAAAFCLSHEHGRKLTAGAWHSGRFPKCITETETIFDILHWDTHLLRIHFRAIAARISTRIRMDTAMPIAFVAFMASCCPDVILCHGLTVVWTWWCRWHRLDRWRMEGDSVIGRTVTTGFTGYGVLGCPSLWGHRSVVLFGLSAVSIFASFWCCRHLWSNVLIVRWRKLLRCLLRLFSGWSWWWFSLRRLRLTYNREHCWPWSSSLCN